MTFFDYFNVGWPWMGLGIGAVLLILLFGTDLLHPNGGSRWKDVTWLVWLAVPVYQIHQFDNPARSAKALKKAKNLAEFMTAVDVLFREQELVLGAGFPGTP